MKALPFLVLGGALLAHGGQRLADEARAETQIDTQFMFRPDGARMRLASMSYRTHVADLLWLKAVLTFGSQLSQTPTPEWREWLGGMISTATTLDPQWRTPYSYGGLMLKVVEAYDLSTEIFLKGAEAIPEDHFLLFSAGMNHFLYMDDPQGAYELLKRASDKPNAPAWYKGAARAFLIKKSQPRIAIRFLSEELDATSDPALRKSLSRHLANSLYDLRSGELEEARLVLEQDLGRPIQSLEELLSLGGVTELPEDPLDGEWVLDKDGLVRSSVAAEKAAEQDLRYERGLLLYMGRWPGR